MPIDDLAGGLIQAIARFFGWVILDILLEIVFYWIGKISLRIISFGKYPPRKEEKHCEGCVQALGLVVLIAVVVSPFLFEKII